ncbi:MAG: hypothetical protein ACK5O7_05915 [Holosporales bacterium]
MKTKMMKEILLSSAVILFASGFSTVYAAEHQQEAIKSGTPGMITNSGTMVAEKHEGAMTSTTPAIKPDVKKDHVKKHKKHKHGKIDVVIPEDKLKAADVMIGSASGTPVAKKLAKKIVKIEHPEYWQIPLPTHTGILPSKDDVMIGSAVGSKAGDKLKDLK